MSFHLDQIGQMKRNANRYVSQICVHKSGRFKGTQYLKFITLQISMSLGKTVENLLLCLAGGGAVFQGEASVKCFL